ncbi:MAG: hypothetical protein ACFB8W_07605 [Elainellaceae cyanobacterium]
MAQQRSVRELTLQGDRQPKHLYLFATYSIEPGKDGSSDRAEKLLAWFVEQYETLKGQKEQREQNISTHSGVNLGTLGLNFLLERWFYGDESY